MGRKIENIIIAIILIISLAGFAVLYLNIDNMLEKDYEDYYTVIGPNVKMINGMTVQNPGTAGMKIVAVIYREKETGKLFTFNDNDKREYIDGKYYTDKDGNQYEIKPEHDNQVTIEGSKDSHEKEKVTAIAAYAVFLVVFTVVAFIYKSKTNTKREIEKIKKEAENM